MSHYSIEQHRHLFAAWAAGRAASYERLIQLIRLCLRGEPLWMVEQYWPGHQ